MLEPKTSTNQDKYVCYRFECVDFKTKWSKGKKYNGLREQIYHNRRHPSVKFSSNYFSQEHRRNQNIFKDFYTPIEIFKEIKKQEKDYKNFHTRKRPSKGKTKTKRLINGLITFSETIDKDLGFQYKENREWFFEIIEGFLKEELKQVISIDFHFDEKTPHIHFQGFNYIYEEHSNYNQSTLKKGEQSFHQDRLEEYLKSRIEDFQYKRGKIKNNQQYQVDKTNKFHYIKDLEKEIENLDKEILNKKSLLVDFLEDINIILKDLEEYSEEKDIRKFIKLVERYSTNEEKLKKFLHKWENGLNTKKQKGVKNGKYIQPNF